MWSFSILRSIGLVLATWPFTLLRLVIMGGLALAFLVAVATGAGLGWGIGHIGSADFRAGATFWGGLIGFAGVSIWVWTLREYLTYLLTAGHVAAMVLVLDGRSLPSGREQIAFATEAVKARFGEIHLLFVLDQAVKGAVGAVVGLFDWMAMVTALPGLQGLVRLVGAVLRMSTTFLDEVVLAREIREVSADPWTTAREGIVLYAQNAPEILKNAVWLTVLRWALGVVLFVVMLAPAGIAAYLIPGAASGWTLLVSLIFALALVRALIDPFCIASLMQVYFAATAGQRPDPAWDARLAEASAPFRDLVDRARAAFRGQAAATP